MQVKEIQKALIESANLVALAVVRMNRPKDDMMTQRQLFARYDRAWLKYHLSRGNIRGVKAGAGKTSPILYSLLEVEALRRADELNESYLKA